MPSSLIIVALVVAWLLVLVPIVARRRQEVARTADSTLAARVVRSGGVHSTVEREPTMSDTAPSHTDEVDDRLDEELDEEFAEEFAEDDLEDFEADEYEDDPAYDDEYEDYEQAAGPARPFRRGRGGFDAEAAAMTARARYTFRQRVVVLMLMAAVLAGVLAVTVSPLLWWAHAIVDIGLVGYLAYLRRQVRIENEIRQRRAARLTQQRRAAAPQRPVRHDVPEPPVEEEQPVLTQRRPLTRHVHPGTVVVDTDDEDPAFAELDEPGALPYRRAVGE